MNLGIQRQILVSEIGDDSEFNCRGRITPSDVEVLVTDIRANGLINPILVRPSTQVPGKKYQVIAGFSRFMAIRILRWKEITCVVRECNESEAAFLNLSENVIRTNLNWLQEARAIQMIRMHNPSMNDEAIGLKLNKSRGWVQLRSYILQLPEKCQQAAAEGILTVEHIRSMWQAPDEMEQLRMLKKCKEGWERKVKVDLTPKIEKSVFAKSQRTKSEIFAMMKHITDNLGPSLTTRFGAWCAGEIDAYDFFCDIQLIKEELGEPYEIPKDPLPEM